MVSIGLVAVVIAVIVVLFTMTGLVKSGSGGRKVIKPEEAKALIGKKDVVLADVRSKAEYNGGHIKGAISLPLPELGISAEKVIGAKDKIVIVYCHSGGRSRAAVSLLLRMGYQTVYDLGGMMGWPYEIV